MASSNRATLRGTKSDRPDAVLANSQCLTSLHKKYTTTKNKITATCSLKTSSSSSWPHFSQNNEQKVSQTAKSTDLPTQCLTKNPKHKHFHRTKIHTFSLSPKFRRFKHASKHTSKTFSQKEENKRHQYAIQHKHQTQHLPILIHTPCLTHVYSFNIYIYIYICITFSKDLVSM